jgi:flagellar biosynthetic protein FliR
MPDRTIPEYNTVTGYAVLVLKEALTGLLMGYGCSICTTIIGFAGRIIDMETGLSMASLVDPTTKEDTSITGVFYQYVVLLILLISGMYQYIIKALAESYTLIPVAGAVFPTDKLMEVMLQFMADYIMIGFRICLPMFAVMLMTNAVLGILTKVAPQMNMFSVGMQIKVLVGFCVLFITTGMLPGIADAIYTEVKTMMVAFVEAMM